MTKTETIIADIYAAWRAQDLEWLASHLPDDFTHMIYIPIYIPATLGGLCRGKAAALERLGLIAQQFDFPARVETKNDPEEPYRARDPHSLSPQTGMQLETIIRELLDLRGRLAGQARRISQRRPYPGVQRQSRGADSGVRLRVPACPEKRG